ncbi:MAG TPA: hypothetical protein VHM25_06380 [Polyangiaceae bacterium]|jgi:hypothetical protein|nr:hypothetical protein [Polyangiaceae bacterium]
MSDAAPMASPSALGWAQLRALLLTVGLLGPACASSAPAEDPDSALPGVSDDSCARFGFRFNAGSCPDAECAEPLCSCPAAISCIPGKNERCMTGVDCSVACLTDPETLLSCSLDIAPCRVDADCDVGLCVVEPGATDGECESGERGARCRNDQDCWVGNCVAGLAGNRACSPGEASDLCNRDSDCLSLRCTRATDALTGECGS